MKLVIFSNYYPYGYDESFISNELHIAEKVYKEIFIICNKTKDKSHVQYVPKNTVVIERSNNVLDIVRSGFSFFSWRTVKDIIYSQKVLEQKVDKYTLKKILNAKMCMLASARVARFFGKMDDAVVYSYWLTGLAWGAIEFGKRVNAHSIVARTHGADCFVNRGYQPFRRELLSNLDAVFSVSSAGVEELRSRIIPTIEPNSKTSLIKLGRLGVFGGERNPNERTEYLRVVSCSHIIPLKRLDLLIDALQLLDESIKIEWYHFGDGNQSSYIKQYANRLLKGKDNIIYHFQGTVPNEAVHSFYEDSHVDVFINTSDYEGLPVSIMEALAHGIPVIARNVGGISEIVTEDSGWLLPKECNPQMISDLIAQLLQDGCRKLMLKRDLAFKTWKSQYSAENNYQLFFDEINRL